MERRDLALEGRSWPARKGGATLGQRSGLRSDPSVQVRKASNPAPLSTRIDSDEWVHGAGWFLFWLFHRGVAVEVGMRFFWGTQIFFLGCQRSKWSPRDTTWFLNQKRLHILDFHFDKFSTQATFACWKIRFTLEFCICSQFFTEAMQWIKKMELNDSTDELRISSSIRDISVPNFEVLDAMSTSALNKFIHNSHFKKRISLEEQKAQKQDCFLRGKRFFSLDLRSLPGHWEHDSVENYTDLFTFVLRNGDIQEFDSKWDGILLSMTKIPLDDILEWLYKLRIRESEKLKTALELYILEIHQIKFGPNYHKLENNDEKKYRAGNSK